MTLNNKHFPRQPPRCSPEAKQEWRCSPAKDQKIRIVSIEEQLEYAHTCTIPGAAVPIWSHSCFLPLCLHFKGHFRKGGKAASAFIVGFPILSSEHFANAFCFYYPGNGLDLTDAHGWRSIFNAVQLEECRLGSSHAVCVASSWTHKCQERVVFVSARIATFAVGHVPSEVT